MPTLEEAIKAVVDAVDGLEAAVAPAPAPDALRAVVEAQLVSEGWTAPAAPEAETPVEDAGEPSEAPAE